MNPETHVHLLRKQKDKHLLNQKKNKGFCKLKQKYTLKRTIVNTLIGLVFVAIGVFLVEIARSETNPLTGIMFLGTICFVSGLVIMVAPHKLMNK